MPVRITCPSCSATLSIKDEHASRAVKCPKCAGIIPPQPAPPETVSEPDALPTLPPPPPPEPQAKAPAPRDEDDRPRRKRDQEEGEDRPRKRRDEEDDEDRPRKKRRDDDDEDDRPRKRRDEDDRDEDDRPRKRRRDEDDEDRDEDRPRRKRRDDDEDDSPVVTRRKPPPKSGIPTILIITGLLLLSCCGVGGYGIYWFTNEVKDKLETVNPAVTKSGYDTLKVGTTTRAQAESALGKGRAPTADDLAKIFGNDKSSAATWQGAVGKGRALMWRNLDDYILVMFHPGAEADARVQMKDWKPKAPPGNSEGSTDDAAFVQKYPPGGADVSGPAVEVTAEDLSTAYKGGKAAADAKYKDKVVLVEGVLDALDMMPDGVVYARLVGTGTVAAAGNVQPRCVVQPGEVNKVFNLSKGQTVKFRGKCAGQSGPFVDVMSAKVESTKPDPAITVNASTLLSAYATNEGAADDRYKDKRLTVTSAVVESKTADAVYFTAKTAKSALRIKVAIAGDFRKLYDELKPGDSRKLKGECGGKLDNDVFLNGAWIAP